MSKPIEGCPQPDEPIRERAYTDRQLLELAAKAIGGSLSEGQGKRRVGETWDEWEWYGPLGINTPEGPTIYPLTDDGDALRLAVKLRISLEMDETYVFGLRTRYSESGMCECWNNDPCAAARRAIVRAAAAIAEGGVK